LVFDGYESRNLDRVYPGAYPGLSHREWGDRTGALAFIIEASDPEMGDNLKTQETSRDDIPQRRVRDQGTSTLTIQLSGAYNPRMEKVHLGILQRLGIRYEPVDAEGRIIPMRRLDFPTPNEPSMHTFFLIICLFHPPIC
jgi:hypothetical protein